MPILIYMNSSDSNHTRIEKWLYIHQQSGGQVVNMLRSHQNIPHSNPRFDGDKMGIILFKHYNLVHLPGNRHET